MVARVPLFDAHFHVIDPRFPLVPNRGYLPEPFLCADYLERVAGLGVTGGTVVSGSFQAFDQSYLVAALAELGPAFVGVTQIPPSVTDEEILSLDAAGVRAVRFNLRRGGSAGLSDLDRLARRVYDLAGWHAEIYVDSRELPKLSDQLCRLPAVSIDHLGLSRDGFASLLRFVERGGYVKASGFGRVNFDVAWALSELAAVAPSRILFGTDLPSTRAPRPFGPEDVSLVCDALGEERARLVLSSNAIALYRPREVAK